MSAGQPIVEAAGKAAALAALCGSMLLGSVTSAQADTLIRVPASDIPEVFAMQQTMLEAWQVVAESYVDDTFNGRIWEADLAEGLIDAAAAKDSEEAMRSISAMLSHLGDPYTRIIPASEYADFRVGSDGELQGVGLLLARDPGNQRLMVLASLDGSPAARAGIKPGDEVVSIDGTETNGFNTDKVAALLRGKRGTNVAVRFARRSQQVPGVAGRPELPPEVQLRLVNLRRERLEVSPVYSTAFARQGSGGRASTTGYIRLANFSMHAANDVHKAIDGLKRQGASSLILDLRGNPGGLVASGVETARLFLDAPAPIFNVAGRIHHDAPELPGTPTIMQRVVLDSSRALTQAPLAVLVDGSSASASEILAGALRDGHRAVLIGDHHTYGKGKIQNVFELADGSALFVTVASYKTPALTDIDQKGLDPDMRCTLQDAAGADKEKQLPPGLPPGMAFMFQTAERLQEDSCILTAERFLDGLVAAAK